jgi:hypothetical protein
VELQLCHNADIKGTIDRAWGVTHNKHKKKDASTARLEADDPYSREKLQLLPLGQDYQRKRFWAADGVCTDLLSLADICVYLLANILFISWNVRLIPCGQ